MMSDNEFEEMYQKGDLVWVDPDGREWVPAHAHASLTEKVRLAVVELVEQDKWEKPMMRLCEIAGLEYPAIATKVEPRSIDALLGKWRRR